MSNFLLTSYHLGPSFLPLFLGVFAHEVPQRSTEERYDVFQFKPFGLYRKTRFVDILAQQNTLFGDFTRDFLDMTEYLPQLKKDKNDEYSNKHNDYRCYKEKQVHLKEVIHTIIVSRYFLMCEQ